MDALLGRVSSDLNVTSRVIKIMCAVTMGWRLRRYFVLRRLFRLAILLRLSSAFPSPVLELGKYWVIVALGAIFVWLCGV